MPEFNITPQIIYDKTNGGLTIIQDYYPDATEAAKSKRHFKTRAERTASSTIREYNGIWYVKDFGSSEKAKDAIGIVMEEEGFQFLEALNWIAAKYQIETVDTAKLKPSYGFEKLEAEEGDQVGQIDFKPKDFDMQTLQEITAYQVWNRLKGINLKAVDGQLEKRSDEVAFRNASDMAKRLGLVNLEYYTFVSRDKKTKNLKKSKYIATDTYPIIMWEAGTWRKIAKPKELDKKRRFLIHGTKNRVMFGYADAAKMLEDKKQSELRADNLTWESEDERVKEIRTMKLDEIIICSGGSDAFNIRCCGYPVVWFDNEMFNLNQDEYVKLFSISHRVYYLPDIDSSGIKEAIKMGKEYLNIEMIFLPDKLREEYDFRGNRCKDVRDFFRRHTSKDFDNLVAQAMPFRFWDQSYKKSRDGKEATHRGKKLLEFKPNPELITNFLFREGFGQYQFEDDKRGYTIIHREDNVVEGELNFERIYKHIKAFLKSDPVMRLVKHSYLDLANSFNRSPIFSENILKQLPEMPLTFQSYGKNFQYMFFERNAWKIYPTKIEEYRLSDCPVNVWKNEVIEGKGKLMEAPFEITEKDGLFDIKINETDNIFLNFLIQTSRIHWRDELENKIHVFDYARPEILPEACKNLKTKEEYLEKYKFAIDGPLLSEEQIYEQKMVLISKLSAFGYLAHRHKDKAESYCVWGTDHSGTQTTEDFQSYGGTGKSIAFDLLSTYQQLKKLDGQNPEQMKDKYNLEGTTKHTGTIYVDDAGKYFHFERFFAIVTSFCEVNPKGRSTYVLEFHESPKLAITSNLPPKKNDTSTRRRMWFVTFSDYYHVNTNGNFNENRKPGDEFGVTLFGDNFSAEQWQKTHNMVARMIQTWLRFGKIEGVENIVIKNILLNNMTLNFKTWADTAFHPDNGRLDEYVQRVPLYEYYKRSQSHPVSPQVFADKLGMWCEYNGFVLNPREKHTSGGRIMKHVEEETYMNGDFTKKEIGIKPDGSKKYHMATRECFFIATPDGQESEKEGEDDMPF